MTGVWIVAVQGYGEMVYRPFPTEADAQAWVDAQAIPIGYDGRPIPFQPKPSLGFFEWGEVIYQ